MSDATTGAPEPRIVDAGRGVGWWGDTWALFTRSAALWVVLGLLLLVILIVLSVIPLLGTLVASLLLPVFAGSWMLAARKVETGGTLEVGDLFSAFRGDKLTPLLVLGALMLGATVLIGLVAGGFGLGATVGMIAGGANHSIGTVLAALGAGLLALLVVLALGTLVTMAVWFAPALVMFRGTPPLDALKASMAASLKNLVPFMLYGMIYIVASIVASIPFGLGWIVLLPVTLLSVYVSYKDVFGA